MKKIIEINNLNIDYDNNEDTIDAISDVSLDIYENEFVCIVGPSGCGKSTLLKVIAGFVEPTKGTVLMDGKPVIGPDKIRGVVFQEPNLLPWFTVSKNVSLGPSFKGLDKTEIAEICDKYLQQVELQEYKDQKVFELSGGQKQRVAIARTLANDPEVILMDEPFGALDSFTRKKMQVMIRQLWKKNNATIFFVTHDIEEALLLGTKIYVMRKGLTNIVKTYDLNYSELLYVDPHSKVTEEPVFIKLKEEINSLLEE